jgi:hypothetical protein
MRFNPLQVSLNEVEDLARADHETDLAEGHRSYPVYPLGFTPRKHRVLKFAVVV